VALLFITIPWDPIVATFGGIVLAWHGVFTAVGILAGVQIALYVGKKIRYDEDDAYSIALVGVPSGVVGARLLYVIEHWSFFSAAPLEIFAINEGGISVWGAVIGGVVGGATTSAAASTLRRSGSCSGSRSGGSAT
jgi:phosphatidylglycerol---prolipoprotein diacylglyceryl transferase